MNILYFSPMLLGLNLLLAVAIAATALWAMTRPQPGPGYWMAGAWTLIAGVLLFMLFMVTGSRLANVLGNALQLAGEALLVLGVFRFLGQRLPYWLLPAAVLVMVAFNIDYWWREGNSDFLMGVYSTIAGLLPLQAIWLLLRTQVEPATRAARLLVAICLGIYSLVTLWRGALGYYEAWLGLAYSMPHESFSYLLPYNFAIPALVMGFVGMTLMTMQRILAQREQNARVARDSADRFRRLLRVSSAGIALIRQGCIDDCNQRLEQLSGYPRAALLGMPVEQLFAPEEQEQVHYVLSDGADGVPIELQVKSLQGREFVAEVSVLGAGQTGHHLLELRDVSHRKALESELRQLVRHDDLTGALNQRGLHERMALELARTNQHGDCLAVICLELDNFRQISEAQVPAAGARALLSFAQLCQRQMGAVDALARLGGERFVLLLPATDADMARRRAQVIIELTGTTNESAADLPLTVSAGVSAWRPGDDAHTLLQRAGQALQLAQAAGGNCVMC